MNATEVLQRQKNTEDTHRWINMLGLNPEVVRSFEAFLDGLSLEAAQAAVGTDDEGVWREARSKVKVVNQIRSIVRNVIEEEQHAKLVASR